MRLLREATLQPTDGARGDIAHVIVDPPTYLVVALPGHRGHLWASREITVPIGDVASVETDRVELGVPRNAVSGYSSARHHHHHAPAIRQAEDGWAR